MLLSVIIPTYQQENYIVTCIQSVLDQQTNFDFEVLVGDDASSDSTSAVVQKFTRDDSRVKLFVWTKNEGGLKNIDKLLSKARGKYVAIIEGDDYFLDTSHLQLAVDSLEQDSKLSFVSSNFYGLIEDRLSITTKFVFNRPKIVRFWHLALGNFIQLGSIVFRRDLYSRVPEPYIDLPLGDYPMTLKLLDGNDGLMLPHFGLAYRIHPDGIWSMKDSNLKRKKTIETIKVFVDNGCQNTHKFLLGMYLSRLRLKKSFSDYLGTLFYYFFYLLRLCSFKFGD